MNVSEDVGRVVAYAAVVLIMARSMRRQLRVLELGNGDLRKARPAVPESEGVENKFACYA